MKYNTDLFQASPPPVVPKQPLFSVENRIRFVTGVLIPLVLALANDGILRMPLPVGDSIAGPGNSYLGVVDVAKTDIKHGVPAPLLDDLAAGYPFLFPLKLFVRPKDWVLRMLLPVQPVRA